MLRTGVREIKAEAMANLKPDDGSKLRCVACSGTVRPATGYIRLNGQPWHIECALTDKVQNTPRRLKRRRGLVS